MKFVVEHKRSKLLFESIMAKKKRTIQNLQQKRKSEPAPAFSWTAHSAQGQTLPAAIVDMQIGTGTNPLSSYVAFTRVRRMVDLLIFRPFDRDLFNKGTLEGAELLLKLLRGEYINWQEIEEKYIVKTNSKSKDKI